MFFSNDRNNDYFSFGIIEPHAFHKNFIPVALIVSIASLFSGTEIYEVLLCIAAALTALLIHFFHEKFTFSEFKSNSIAMIFLIILNLMLEHKVLYADYFVYTIFAYLLGIGIYFFYKTIEKIIAKSISKIEMKNIKKGKLKNREYIYQVLKNKKLIESDKCKILDYIEDNISLASGAWPDMDLFSIHNNSTSSVRIFFLEEKWKEQEESKI